MAGLVVLTLFVAVALLATSGEIVCFVDADLERLRFPAPEPTVEVPDLEPSPALSQLGGTWPTDGRVVGIIVDAEGDQRSVDTVAAAVREVEAEQQRGRQRDRAVERGLALRREAGRGGVDGIVSSAPCCLSSRIAATSSA